MKKLKSLVVMLFGRQVSVVEAMLLHEGIAVLITFIITLFIGIAIGMDIEENPPRASLQSLILIIPLVLSVIGIFYNYTARDVTIQYLIKNKTDKEIKELNITKDIKKIIIYNYLELKEKEIK